MAVKARRSNDTHAHPFGQFGFLTTCTFVWDKLLLPETAACLSDRHDTPVGVASSSRGPAHSPTPFKFVQVLAALGRPDAALAVLRARSHAGSASHQSSQEAFQEAQTALSIRLQCGVFTEACSQVCLYLSWCV